LRAAQGRSSLWVLLYHAGRSPLPKALDDPSGPYKRQDGETRIGESLILHFRIQAD
jgi:hypothetical protein